MIKTFKLTEVQAEAILNMRLRNLRRLEEMEIRQEDKDLRAEKKSLEDLLRSEKAQWKIDCRPDPRGARKVRPEDAARQAPHRLCRSAGA